MSGWDAAAPAAAAAWWACPAPVRRPSRAVRKRLPARLGAPRSVRVVAGAGLSLAAVSFLGAAGGVCAVGVAATLIRLRNRARDARTRAAWRSAWRGVLEALAAGLRAGAEPLSALLTALLPADSGSHRTRASPGRTVEQEVRELASRVSAAETLGGDVAGALARSGPEPARLAACWQVCVTRGAPLAGAVDRLREIHDAEETQRREVEAALAAPRASARLLALLPLLGLLLGQGIGARPLHVLLATPVGALALISGCSLDLAGLWLTERMTDAVLRGLPGEPG
ncbi:MAG: type II secretion system F family protein, partial [Mycobacteriales bacterium]